MKGVLFVLKRWRNWKNKALQSPSNPLLETWRHMETLRRQLRDMSPGHWRHILETWRDIYINVYPPLSPFMSWVFVSCILGFRFQVETFWHRIDERPFHPVFIAWNLEAPMGFAFLVNGLIILSMTSKFKKALAVLLVALSLFLLSSCVTGFVDSFARYIENILTVSSFEPLHPGMTEAQVCDLLGKPSSKGFKDGVISYYYNDVYVDVWFSDTLAVYRLDFQDGLLVSFSQVSTYIPSGY